MHVLCHTQVDLREPCLLLVSVEASAAGEIKSPIPARDQDKEYSSKIQVRSVVCVSLLKQEQHKRAKSTCIGHQCIVRHSVDSGTTASVEVRHGALVSSGRIQSSQAMLLSPVKGAGSLASQV